MALTKNKYLRGLKQNAEDTYRMNQGMNMLGMSDEEVQKMTWLGISGIANVLCCIADFSQCAVSCSIKPLPLFGSVSRPSMKQ